MKIKHNAGSKTDREKLAKQILQGSLDGQSLKEKKLSINLPPDILSQTAQLSHKLGDMQAPDCFSQQFFD